MRKSMEPQSQPQGEPQKGKRWLKLAGIIIGVLILVMIVSYHYVTSAHFVRHVVFPLLGKRMQRTLSADEIRIKPFSQVELGNFQLTNPQKPEEPPLVGFKHFTVKYDLFSLLRGSPDIEDLQLSEPQANLVTYADGSSNLDGIVTEKVKREKPRRPGRPARKKAPELPEFSIGSMQVNQGKVRLMNLDKAGKPEKEITLADVDFSLNDFSPGKEATLALSLTPQMKEPARLTEVTDGRISMQGQVQLSRDLSRTQLEGSLSVKDLQGKFQGNPLDGYEVASKINLKQDNEVVQLEPFSTVVSRQGETGGRISATGKYDLNKGEGNFEVAVENIDRTLLNLIGSQAGDVDFRNTTINQTLKLAIAEQAKKFEVEGELNVKNFSILAPEVSKTPTEEIDVAVRHRLRFDGTTDRLEIARLDMEAVQQGRTFASGALDQPLTLDLSQAKEGMPSAPPIHYKFAITDFDLAPYQTLVPLPEGTRLEQARLNSQLKVMFADSGKDIAVEGNLGVSKLKGAVVETPLPAAELNMDMKAKVKDFSQLNLSQFDLLMTQPDGSENSFSMQGNADLKAGSGAFQLEVVQLDLPSVSSLAPTEEVKISQGKVQGKVALTLSQQFSAVESKGEVDVTGLSASIGENRLKNFHATTRFDTAMEKTGAVEIRTLDMELRPQNQPAGTVSISGNLNPQTGEGSLQLTVKEANERLLNSMLEEGPVDLHIASLGMNYSGQVELKNQFRDLSAAGELSLENFSVKSKKLKDLLVPPLELTVKHDAGMTGEEIDLRTMRVSFAPASSETSTPAPGEKEAEGSMEFKGKLNLKAGEGAMQLAISNLNEKLLNLVAGQFLGDRRLSSVAIEGKQDLTVANEFKNVTAIGDFAISDLKMVDAKTGQQVIPPLDMRFKNDVQVSESEIIVKEASLELIPEGRPAEHLDIKADIVRQTAAKTRKSKVEVRADRITLDNYLVFAPVAAAQKAKERRPSVRKPEQPPEELPALDLKDIELEGVADIKALNYQQLAVKDLLLNTTMANNVVNIDNFTMKVNDANFDTKGKVKVDVPGWQYEMNTTLEQLPMQPVVDSLMPKMKGKATGTANLAVAIEGQGTIPQNLERHLRGTVKGELAEGKFAAIPILTALADATRIPELEELRFFRGDVDLDIGEGKINVTQLDFKGKLEKLGVRGWFGLDERIDLSLQVALGPPLNQKLKELRYVGEALTDSEGYTQLPVPVGMSGTFSNPEPTLKLEPAIKETGKKILEDLLERELRKRRKK